MLISVNEYFEMKSEGKDVNTDKLEKMLISTPKLFNIGFGIVFNPNLALIMSSCSKILLRKEM